MILHARATKNSPGVGGVGEFSAAWADAPCPNQSQHLKLELFNILRKLIWLTEYLHITIPIVNKPRKPVQLAANANGFILQNNKRILQAHGSVRTPKCIFKRFATIPGNVLASTYYSLEDADLRARFPELVKSVGSSKFHNACDVTDDDRGKYCQLEG